MLFVCDLQEPRLERGAIYQNERLGAPRVRSAGTRWILRGQEPRRRALSEETLVGRSGFLSRPIVSLDGSMVNSVQYILSITMTPDAEDTYRERQGSVIASGSILVPQEITLTKDRTRIGWSFRKHLIVRPKPVILDQFLKLAPSGRSAADPDAILQFAKKWGALQIGPNRRPCWLSMDGEGSDPIDAWVHFASRATAITRIAAALNASDLGDDEDWDQLLIDTAEARNQNATRKPRFHRVTRAAHVEKLTRYGLAAHGGVPMISDEEWPEIVRIEKLKPFRSLAERESARKYLGLLKARSIIESEITRWMELWRHGSTGNRTASDFSFGWDDSISRWRLAINNHSFLFAELALQLAVSITRGRAWLVCSCGRTFLRKDRLPRADQVGYCSACRKAKKPVYEAMKRSRAKQRARALFHTSLGDFEIAERVGCSIAQIAEWRKEPQATSDAGHREGMELSAKRENNDE